MLHVIIDRRQDAMSLLMFLVREKRLMQQQGKGVCGRQYHHAATVESTDNSLQGPYFALSSDGFSRTMQRLQLTEYSVMSMLQLLQRCVNTARERCGGVEVLAHAPYDAPTTIDAPFSTGLTLMQLLQRQTSECVQTYIRPILQQLFYKFHSSSEEGHMTANDSNGDGDDGPSTSNGTDQSAFDRAVADIGRCVELVVKEERALASYPFLGYLTSGLRDMTDRLSPQQERSHQWNALSEVMLNCAKFKKSLKFVCSCLLRCMLMFVCLVHVAMAGACC